VLIDAYGEGPLEGTRTGSEGIKHDEAAARVAHEGMIDVVGVNKISGNPPICSVRFFGGRQLRAARWVFL
jgi:hypothetical protein